MINPHDFVGKRVRYNARGRAQYPTNAFREGIAFSLTRNGHLGVSWDGRNTPDYLSAGWIELVSNKLDTCYPPFPDITLGGQSVCELLAHFGESPAQDSKS